MDRYEALEFAKIDGGSGQAVGDASILSLALHPARRKYSLHAFCKAYLLKDLRRFDGWSEKRPSNGEEYTDETVCFLWDDFTVVKDPIYDQEPLFEEVTPEWTKFCQTVLQFAVPEEMS